MNNLETRKRKITDFLNQVYRNILNSKSLSGDYIYNALCSIDLPKEEIGLMNKEYYSYWLERYANKKNIEIYKEKYFGDNFLIFTNYKFINHALYRNDPVKIYVAYKHDYLQKNVDKIMDYLRENDIIHFSKVAKIMRNDMITIRVRELEDAKKLVKFINESVTDGALLTNPFLMTDGIVGLAVDNHNSYNTKVSELIYDYMDYKLKHNDSIVDYDDFLKFTKNYKFPPDQKCDYIYLEEIIRLIILSLTSNDINKFIDHYNNVSDNKEKNKTIDNIKMVETLVLFIRQTIKKHGPDFARMSLFEYIFCGNPNSLSRIPDKNGILNRDLLLQYDYSDVKEALYDVYNARKPMSIINDLVETNTKIIESIDESEYNNKNISNNIETLKQVAKMTYKKYNLKGLDGYMQIYNAIVVFLSNGNSTFFTRLSFDNKECRSLLDNINYNTLKAELINYYKTSSLEEIAESFISEFIKPQNKTR